MRRLAFVLPLLAVLAACVPAVAPEPPEARLDGGRFATAAFVDPVTGAAYATAYEVLGDGPPVVLVHGIGGGSSLFQYRFTAPALAAAGYRAYAVDLLGFGRSSRPAIRSTQDLLVAQVTSFLEDTVGERAVLLANGLAGAHAIRIAAERPDLVAGLVLIAPTGYRSLNRPQGPERVRAFDLLANPVIGELFAGALLSPAAQEFFLLDAYASRESLTPEVRESYDRNLRVADARWVVFSFVSGNLDQDVSELWPATTQPSLLVWGTASGFSSYEDAEDFGLARPDARILLLRDAALLPNEERAPEFEAAVIGFLRGIGW